MTGITNQLINNKAIFRPASIDAKGPTRPTKPNPAEAGVPEMENKATGIAEMAAVIKQGIRMIGFLNRFGIIIFIAPRAIAIVTPGLLIFHELTTKTMVVAATPIAAAPADIPFN